MVLQPEMRTPPYGRRVDLAGGDGVGLGTCRGGVSGFTRGAVAPPAWALFKFYI